LRRRERVTLERASLERALLVAAAGAMVVFSVRTAWYGGGWNASGGDYTSEFAPAMRALLQARVSEFFDTLPVYGAGGSILLRAPFAGLGALVAGGEHAAYRFGALECLLALDAVGLWLALKARARGVAWPSAAGVLALCAVAPALLGAVANGHPEEALGAALSVGALLATSQGSTRLGGLLLGLALVNKAWAVLAVGPVLLSAPPARRRELWPGAAVLGAWLVAAASINLSRLWQSLHGASDAIVAHPQDLWWPLARPDGVYHVPPALLASHARELAVLVALALAAALALATSRARRAPMERECLALLAIGFALRCVLEPSAHAYYQLPLVVALAAWELRAWGSVALSAALAILLAFDFGRLEEAGAGAPFALYLALLVPVCSILSAELAGRRGRAGGAVLGNARGRSSRAG
jgi:hypothetical protein